MVDRVNQRFGSCMAAFRCAGEVTLSDGRSLDEHGVARHHLRVGDVLISVDGRTPADAYAVTAQLNTLHGVASATKGPLLSVSRGVAGQAAVQCTEGMWSR